MGVVAEPPCVLPKRLLLKGSLFCCRKPLVPGEVQAKSVVF